LGGEMDSKELNERIEKICDDDNLYKAFGGKAIPYVGWFWRDVNFDTEDCLFGVLPDGKLGFMENNKWNYDYHYCEPEDWQEIRRLLEIAVAAPSRESLKAVDDKIQSLRD
jgi:hypothetical protein